MGNSPQGSNWNWNKLVNKVFQEYQESLIRVNSFLSFVGLQQDLAIVFLFFIFHKKRPGSKNYKNEKHLELGWGRADRLRKNLVFVPLGSACKLKLCIAHLTFHFFRVQDVSSTEMNMRMLVRENIGAVAIERLYRCILILRHSLFLWISLFHTTNGAEEKKKKPTDALWIVWHLLQGWTWQQQVNP